MSRRSACWLYCDNTLLISADTDYYYIPLELNKWYKVESVVKDDIYELFINGTSKGQKTKLAASRTTLKNAIFFASEPQTEILYNGIDGYI